MNRLKPYGILAGYELEKLYRSRVTCFALAIAALLLFIISLQNYIVVPEYRYSWEAEKELDGRALDDDFIAELCTDFDDDWDYDESTKNKRRFADGYLLWVLGANLNSKDARAKVEMPAMTETRLYERRQELIEEIQFTYFLSDGELRYWEAQENRIEKPFIYRSSRGCLLIWDSYVWVFFVTAFCIVLCLSQVFSGESAVHTDAMIYACKYGRKHVFLAKIISGVIFSMVTSVILLTACHIPVYIFDGIHGTKGTWQMILPLSSLNMTIGQVLRLYTLVFFTASILTGIFTMMLSLLLNHGVAAMGIAFGVIMLDLLLGVPSSLRVISQIKSLFPIAVLNHSMIPDMRLVKVFGKYFISIQAGIGIYMILSALLISFAYWVFRKRY